VSRQAPELKQIKTKNFSHVKRKYDTLNNSKFFFEISHVLKMAKLRKATFVRTSINDVVPKEDTKMTIWGDSQGITGVTMS